MFDQSEHDRTLSTLFNVLSGMPFVVDVASVHFHSHQTTVRRHIDRPELTEVATNNE